jgi:hypothetical protein
MEQSGRQPLAALGPSPLDNGLTGTRAHAHTKTMGTLSLQVGWLKCSLAHILILVFNNV